MQEIPCSTSAGSQRLLVFMLSPSEQPLLLTHNIGVSQPSPISPLYLLFIHFYHWNGTSPMTETASFTTWWRSNYIFVTVFAFHELTAGVAAALFWISLTCSQLSLFCFCYVGVSREHLLTSFLFSKYEGVATSVKGVVNRMKKKETEENERTWAEEDKKKKKESGQLTPAEAVSVLASSQATGGRVCYSFVAVICFGEVQSKLVQTAQPGSASWVNMQLRRGLLTTHFSLACTPICFMLEGRPFHNLQAE